MLEHAAPLVKVTIVPRGQSLGAAWYLPEERLIVRPDQMLDEMCATMGGRAAEKVTFNRISTGALSDLEKVTKQARAMVTIYGLNEKIGNVTYYDSSGQSEYNFSKPYSEETARIIDEEISARTASPAELTLGNQVLALLAQRFTDSPLYARIDMVTNASGVPEIMEIELTEPSLYLHLDTDAPLRAANVLASAAAAARK